MTAIYHSLTRRTTMLLLVLFSTLLNAEEAAKVEQGPLPLKDLRAFTEVFDRIKKGLLA